MKYILSGILAFCFTYCCYSQAKQERPNYKLLWKISGKNLSKPSYLFGTMHVNDNKAYDFSDSVLLKLLSCEAFAMEVHPDSVVSSIVKLMVENPEKKENKFKSIFNEREYRELDSLLKLKSGYSLEKLKSPSMAEFILEKNEFKNKDQKTFLDAYLYGIAKNNKKQIIGLEKVSDQMSLLDYLSPAEIKKIMYSYLKKDSIEKKSYSADYSQLLNVYHSGDIDGIYSMMQSTYKFSKEYYDRLITFRNEGMARNIIGNIHDRSTFIAVGAAHLPGTEGLINILQKEGYTVTKVNSPFSGLASKYKYQLEENAWSSFSFPKGGYSIKMPTDPIPFNMDTVGITLQMSFDLAAGSIFQSTFINLNNQFQGKSSKYIFDQFEENFKKSDKYSFDKSQKIEMAGLEAREFWSQNKDDVFKTRLVLRNNVLYLLMAGPTKDHANSPEATIFFNSFKPIEFVKETWKTYSSPQGAFSINQWGTPDTKSVSLEDPEGSGPYHLNIVSSINNASHESYLIRYNDFPPGRVTYNDSVYYTSLINNFYAELKGRSLKIENKVIDNFKGKEFSFELSEEGVVRGRVVLRGNRAYFLLTTSSKQNSQETTEEFLNSLKFLPYTSTVFEEYTLEKANIKVKTPSVPLPDEETTTEESFFSDGVIYNSKDSNSGISFIIVHRKIGKYNSFFSKEEFFDKIIKNYIEQGDTIIESREIADKDFLSKQYSIRSKKVNSSKKIKISQRGDDMYIKMCYVPLDFENNPSLEQFLSYLELINRDKTVNDIFTNKTAVLLNDLNSSDSLKAKLAFKSLQEYEFRKSDLPLIYDALKLSFERKEVKENLLETLSFINDDRTRPVVKDLYLSLSEKDNALKIKALSVLSSLKTKEATEDLVHFLSTKAITSDDYSASSIFYPYFDSVALASHLFPKTFHLLKLEEYQNTLFQLLIISLEEEVLNSAVVDLLDQHLDSLILTLNESSFKLSENDEEFYEKLERYKYLTLLLSKLPFSESKAVALNNLLRSGQLEIMLEAAELLINNDQIVSKDVIEKLASADLTRISIFEVLKNKDLTKLFPKKYLTQESFAKSELLQFLSYEDQEIEKIEFVSLKTILYKGLKRELYVFKFKYPEETDWYLGISGPYNKRSKTPENNGELTYTAFTQFDKKQVDEAVQELLEGSESKLLK